MLTIVSFMTPLPGKPLLRFPPPDEALFDPPVRRTTFVQVPRSLRPNMRARNGRQAEMMPHAGSMTVHVITKALDLLRSPLLSVLVREARTVLAMQALML
jgi:hypothetical protein